MARGAETDDVRTRGPQFETDADGGARATLLTDDGVPIEAAYRPAAHTTSDLGIVLAHGFTGTMRRPAVRRAAELFARYGGVVTFSFRGHGGSGGLSTVGDREVLDVDAAVRWARSLGHTRVATVGFSMGGSVVLRQAGLRSRGEAVGGGLDGGADVDGTAPGAAFLAGRVSAGDGLPVSGGDRVRPSAVVAVSSPARWYYRGTPPMRRLHWVVTRPGGRLVSRIGLRTRIDPEGWGPPEVARPQEDAVAGRRLVRARAALKPEPMPPFEAVRLIPPTPLLVVHGDRDAYFPLDHPRSLAEAAGPGCELWIERGFGHAENAAAPELLHRIGAWLLEHV
jgi:pimeloyl-ACP methyl ester carboxylesterase